MISVYNKIIDFIGLCQEGKVALFNEASLQFELAAFLRLKMEDKYIILLEVPVASFGTAGHIKFIKKEIDIVIIDETNLDKCAIELKFPRSGQYPEQMFSFCKDILFLEQLVESRFNTSFFLAFADDHLFWEGKEQDGIYAMFRSGKPINGPITKPTSRIDSELNVKGSYFLNWCELKINQINKKERDMHYKFNVDLRNTKYILISIPAQY